MIQISLKILWDIIVFIFFYGMYHWKIQSKNQNRHWWDWFEILWIVATTLVFVTFISDVIGMVRFLNS